MVCRGGGGIGRPPPSDHHGASPRGKEGVLASEEPGAMAATRVAASSLTRSSTVYASSVSTLRGCRPQGSHAQSDAMGRGSRVGRRCGRGRTAGRGGSGFRSERRSRGWLRPRGEHLSASLVVSAVAAGGSGALALHVPALATLRFSRRRSTFCRSRSAYASGLVRLTSPAFWSRSVATGTSIAPTELRPSARSHIGQRPPCHTRGTPVRNSAPDTTEATTQPCGIPLPR